MNNEHGKVLFISHNATRTGAPILLLNFLKWLKKNSDLTFEVLLRDAGPLVDEFSAIAPVKIARRTPSLKSSIGTHGKKRGLLYWLQSLIGSLKPQPNDTRSCSIQELVEHYSGFGPDIIYSNTVVNGDLLDALSGLDCPVISHIHELDNIIALFGERNWQSVKYRSTHFITASDAVRDNLTENRSVSPNAVDVVYSFVDTGAGGQSLHLSETMRAKLGVPSDALVVCGSGLDEWRKGMDLFIECAAKVNEKSPVEVRFLWVGGWLSEEARLKHEAMAKRLNVEDILIFTGMVPNPLDYYGAADLFALTSREDPFPLVCLEAASMAIPVLCFEGAGGMPVFVNAGAGYVLPFCDTTAMAERIVALAEDPVLRDSLGSQAQKKVRELYDVETGCAKLLQIIRTTMKAA